MSFLPYKAEAGWAATSLEQERTRDSFRVEEDNLRPVPYSSPERREPPEGCAWSGPWEPFAIIGREVVWRRPYVPAVTVEDVQLADEQTFAERR